MRGRYIGRTYKTKNEVWLVKGDIVEIVENSKLEKKENYFHINVLNRTCETSKSNRTKFGCDWDISIKDIILFDGNKLDIE